MEGNISLMSKVMDIKYGISATFNSAKDIFEAAGKVREKGYKNWECYTPIPIHGLDGQMGYSRSKVPLFYIGRWCDWIFYRDAYCLVYEFLDYPLIVGGKPYFSPIFPFPVFYELTILFAAFGTLFGMFFLTVYQDTIIPSLNTKHLEEPEMTSS